MAVQVTVEHTHHVERLNADCPILTAHNVGNIGESEQPLRIPDDVSGQVVFNAQVYFDAVPHPDLRVFPGK
ncbi:hypothetical protein SDC9_194155 [bioreactor metagenome]|uniref:Uncharacterized protein n=1 Tax=bioreactor metagenome TaxID=1076179 RepID=A0A645I5H9_9ZZZZ